MALFFAVWTIEIGGHAVSLLQVDITVNNFDLLLDGEVARISIDVNRKRTAR